MSRSRRIGALAAAAALLATAVHADPLPARMGACSETRITRYGPRLEGAPESGTGVAYENGGSQVSYDVLPGVRRSRVGDRVRLCLVSVPRGCPRGDDRGRVYRATNVRTGESWTAPDSQHQCGGA